MNGEAPAAGRVTVEEPERMNILGLLMKGLLAGNMENPEIRERVKSISGDVLVKAGDMAVTLRFGEGGIKILEGDPGKPRARVSGDMGSLLGVVSEGRMIGPFFAGRLKIGGNPLVLLKILPLIRSKG